MSHVAIVALPKQDIIRPPGALSILAAACKQNQIDYSIHDFNLWLYNNLRSDTWLKLDDNWVSHDPFLARDSSWYRHFLTKVVEYVDLILKSSPTMIAISIFSYQSMHCGIELIQELNRRPQRCNFKIVIGGSGIRTPLATNRKEMCIDLLEQGLIDYYVFGEGEITFQKLLQGIDQYPGINNFDSQQINDLDQFPLPSYDKIDPSQYKFINKPEIIITGSRGCVRDCTYCDVAAYWPKYKFRDGKKIADELYYYFKNYGITHFEFSDSLINGSLKQFKEMNQCIVDYQTLDPAFEISFKGQYICRQTAQMNEADYEKMKQAGCDYLYVGVESFSERIRYDMHKKFSNQDLDHHLRMCGKFGIKNSLLMLVGYPTETIEDHAKNIEWLKQHSHYAKSRVISMIVFGYTASILKDTPLFHMQQNLGIVPEFDPEQFAVTANWISANNPSLTLKERIRRWLELTEIATELGYLMPRNKQYISYFIDLLKASSGSKKIFKLDIEKT